MSSELSQEAIAAELAVLELYLANTPEEMEPQQNGLSKMIIANI